MDLSDDISFHVKSTVPEHLILGGIDATNIKFALSIPLVRLVSKRLRVRRGTQATFWDSKYDQSDDETREKRKRFEENAKCAAAASSKVNLVSNEEQIKRLLASPVIDCLSPNSLFTRANLFRLIQSSFNNLSDEMRREAALLLPPFARVPTSDGKVDVSANAFEIIAPYLKAYLKSFRKRQLLGKLVSGCDTSSDKQRNTNNSSTNPTYPFTVVWKEPFEADARRIDEMSRNMLKERNIGDFLKRDSCTSKRTEGGKRPQRSKVIKMLGTTKISSTKAGKKKPVSKGKKSKVQNKKKVVKKGKAKTQLNPNNAKNQNINNDSNRTNFDSMPKKEVLSRSGRRSKIPQGLKDDYCVFKR